MRLKASIETGAVVPSVILRKLAAAGAGNVLSRALRALGRIERTLFTLQWLSDRRCASAATPVSTKARPATRCGARCSFTVKEKFENRTFENQSFRASGLEHCRWRRESAAIRRNLIWWCA